MTVDLSEDELNLILSALGLAQNVFMDDKAEPLAGPLDKLEALQAKLMAVRDQ